MTPLDVAARYLNDRLGFRLDAALRARLDRTIQRHAAAEGVEPAEWVTRIPQDAEAVDALIGAVTVDESSWFRDPAHFDAVKALVADLSTPMIWSIGAAAGQEAYSLAITLAEAGRSDGRVIATDVDPVAVDATSVGVFSDAKLSGLSDERRDRWLRPVDGGWAVSDELRNRVTCRRHNLAREIPPAEVAGAQIVFCRNVLIYVTEHALVRVFDRLAPLLGAEGSLFLGSSESLWRALDRFEPVTIAGAGCYRLRPAGGGAGAAAAGGAGAAAAGGAGAAAAGGAAGELPSADSLVDEAGAALDGGDAHKAVRLARQAAFLDPDQVLAHFTLGLAQERLGEVAAARRALRAALVAAEPTGDMAAAVTFHLERLGES